MGSEIEQCVTGDGEQLEVSAHGLRFVPGSRPDWMRVERVADGRRVDEVLATGDLVDAAQRWLAERVGAVAPDPVHCTGCGCTLEPVFDGDTDRQFNSALWLTLGGGYGMYLDPIDGPLPEAVLCEACVAQLRSAVPWFDTLIAAAE